MGLEPTTLYSRQSALPTQLPRQISWLGPNLTSHSTPDKQANHQLSMKEKAGVMKPPMTPNTKPSIYMYMFLTQLPRQISWLGPNLTSHSTPDKQANHQLSMKEKAGVMKPPMTPNTKPSIYMYMFLTQLPRQISWLGPNLTSHSTPDKQANHQLSMKEKAGVMKPPMTPNTKPSIYMYMFLTQLPRQISWLGPNLTSHSTPDKQANHQLSMKEKAGVMKPPMTPNTKPSIYMYMFLNER